MSTPDKVEATIQEVFRQGYNSYQKSHPLPSHVRKAVHFQLLCRTPHLGGHSQYCPDGHYQRSHYNSCKHRMCPQCASIQIERWLQKRAARLLNCDYYHLIFTISHDFNNIWLLNVREMANILFRCSRGTIFRLLKDGKYLGAVPGITGSLHTWSQTQLLHPHGHFLVTGGGLTDTEEWKNSSNGFLLPIKLAMKVFRTLFRWSVRKAVRAGKLTLPDDMDGSAFRKLLRETGCIKWNVYIKKKYSHGVGVVKYLARYIRGGPISNKRILSIEDGFVTFSYADSRDKEETRRGKRKNMRLPIDQFIQRYLLHVPPPRIQVVRHYGLHAGSKKDELNSCRALLGQPPVEEPELLDWQTYCSQRGYDHPELCPVCGKRLLCTSSIEYRANYPPIELLLKNTIWN